ncbi:MAG: protease inhibitor I42 family protein [Anaerolineae bacterium]|nr:MAG: protease inhibitor I42 family protein [Anaerolineae bacterium]
MLRVGEEGEMETKENRIQTRVGEEFEIDLAATPSTGYLWNLRACPAVFETLPVERALPTDITYRVGATGAQTFRFRATAAGVYTMTFVLQRPWEKRAIRRCVFQVDVGD